MFDSPEAVRFKEARLQFLEDLLSKLRRKASLTTALDVGAAVGHFSAFLRNQGFHVTATDGRESNVSEMRTRHPDIPSFVFNVEEAPIRRLGSFDLVLCLGLLYHLENPFAAIRNLCALTGSVLLISSMVLPEERPVGELIDEPQNDSQSLNYVALVLSKTALVKMLYRAGFSAVYEPVRAPEHEEFRETFLQRRRRVILIACKSFLDLPGCVVLQEVQGSSPWVKPLNSVIWRGLLFLQKPSMEKWRSMVARMGKFLASLRTRA